MNTIYQTNANDLSVGLIESIKAAYKGKDIEIEVSEISEIDTTDYLLSSPANRDHLMRAIERVEAGDVIIPDQEQFR